MKFLSNNFFKGLMLIIALQIFNTSIDYSHTNYDNNNTVFNYIDTYVEYVAEVILKHQNAIPETTKRTRKQLHNKQFQLMCCSINKAVLQAPLQSLLHIIILNHHDEYAYQFLKEISPPPEAG